MESNSLLMKGNEALSEAILRGGCRYYFGYPITPQNEVSAYLSRRLPEIDGVFLQAESEVAAINMVYGAAGAGARVFTSSSSPGISLKQEGISYIIGSEIPCVIANVQRAGPGLGGIGPSQGDYFQATKGGGHGDASMIVLAPSSVQEIIDIAYDSFEIAEKYRNPVMILMDGTLGQMMEQAVMPEFKKDINPEKPWALIGAKGREPNVIRSYYSSNDELESRNRKLERKYQLIKDNEVRYEYIGEESPELLLVGFGIIGRILGETRLLLEQKGIKTGLFRPISLFPYPYDDLKRIAKDTDNILVSELNMGQMIEDVKLSVGLDKNILFYNRLGGNLPGAAELSDYILKKLHR